MPYCDAFCRVKTGVHESTYFSKTLLNNCFAGDVIDMGYYFSGNYNKSEADVSEVCVCSQTDASSFLRQLYSHIQTLLVRSQAFMSTWILTCKIHYPSSSIKFVIKEEEGNTDTVKTVYFKVTVGSLHRM